MPSTSFYLPEEIALTLERYRDRINVSRVCTRALKQEIAQMQLIEGLEGADANLARLRREKLEAHRADEERGWNAAVRDVDTINYMTLRAISRIDLASPLLTFADELHDWLQDKYFADVGSEPEEDWPEPAIWKRGWLSFMQSYWAQVKDQL